MPQLTHSLKSFKLQEDRHTALALLSALIILQISLCPAPLYTGYIRMMYTWEQSSLAPREKASCRKLLGRWPSRGWTNLPSSKGQPFPSLPTTLSHTSSIQSKRPLLMMASWSWEVQGQASPGMSRPRAKHWQAQAPVLFSSPLQCPSTLLGFWGEGLIISAYVQFTVMTVLFPCVTSNICLPLCCDSELCALPAYDERPTEFSTYTGLSILYFTSLLSKKDGNENKN